MALTGTEILQRLCDAHPEALRTSSERLGEACALVDAERIVAVLRFLRSDEALAFDMLIDITAVDLIPQSPRFEVVYQLYSVAHNHRVRVKAGVPEDPCEIDSVKEVWPAADWLEREVWDMYGITFRNHGDLRRLLLYEEFEGHPLRKDYPKEKRQPLIGPRN